MYKRLVIQSPEQSHKNQFLPVYENNNILKYTQKDIEVSPTEKVFFSKKTSLDFSQELVQHSSRRRKISKMPCKVLDAPALQDDYYLNLIDWSFQNLLAVSLTSSVYLWSATTSKVIKLCDLGTTPNIITSVAWSINTPQLALGSSNGEVQIWDCNKMKRVRIFDGHSNRVGAISWNSTFFSTASRDKTILHRDPRSPRPYFNRLEGHKQ